MTMTKEVKKGNKRLQMARSRSRSISKENLDLRLKLRTATGTVMGSGMGKVKNGKVGRYTGVYISNKFLD